MVTQFFLLFKLFEGRANELLDIAIFGEGLEQVNIYQYLWVN